MNDVWTGLALVVAAGVMGGSFTIPLKFVRGWAWETSWLLYSLVGMVLVPWLLVAWAVPHPMAGFASVSGAELARTAASPVRATAAPPASAQSTVAQNTLATLVNDHSLDAERIRLLLSEAERMRLGLMLLGRLRTRLEREGSPESALLESSPSHHPPGTRASSRAWRARSRPGASSSPPRCGA